MILRGLDIGAPQLGVSGDLGDRAGALYPLTLTRCLPGLDRPDAFGSVAPADLLRGGVDTGPITAALAKLEDPEDLTIHTNVHVQQGVADTTVFQTFTDQLVESFRQHGVPVSYKTYKGLDHHAVVQNTTSAKDATRYIRSRLR
jgi:hypothetical protein